MLTVEDRLFNHDSTWCILNYAKRCEDASHLYLHFVPFLRVRGCDEERAAAGAASPAAVMLGGHVRTKQALA